MVYTANQLITNAFYLAGVTSRDLETVTGDQLTDGLSLLNDLLAVKTANFRLIPYFSSTTIAGVVGQELYFIPNLISIETFTFTQNNLRYSSRYTPRRQYFGSPRVNNINALPFSWHPERTDGGMNLYVYFKPQAVYSFEIWGKFGLASVANGMVDLLLTYERFYLVYLRYALAEYICEDYNLVLQPQALSKLRDLEQQIIDISPLDLTTNKLSTLQSATGSMTWAQINLGQGWTPGGGF